MNSTGSTINIPLAAIRWITAKSKEKRVVCEIDVDEFRMVNDPQTIDELLAEADFDIAAGKYKEFASVDDMVADLQKL